MVRINTNIPALPTWLEKQVNPEKTSLSSQQPAITLKKSHKQNNNSATNPETPGNISKSVNGTGKSVMGEITAIQKKIKKWRKQPGFWKVSVKFSSLWKKQIKIRAQWQRCPGRLSAGE